MLEIYQETLPDAAKALPGLLYGELGQAAELILSATPERSGFLACEFAGWLIEQALPLANQRYSTLDSARIVGIGAMIAKSVCNYNYFSRLKLMALQGIIASFSFCNPENFRVALSEAKLRALTLAEFCRLFAEEKEAENAA